MATCHPGTNYEQGDVVLVRFAFADGWGEKRRPAVIVGADEYHRSPQEAIIAAITSNVDGLLMGDHPIAGWQEAGLLFPSAATAVIRTIKQAVIERRLGAMPAADCRLFRRSWCRC